jgi:hypothetical protein
MMGGILIFLPFSPEEAENYIAGAEISEEQSAGTVEEEKLEQICETAQTNGIMKERSEEWLNEFSQGAEKQEAVALKLAAEEAEK